jgi:putative sterol carrier protein
MSEQTSSTPGEAPAEAEAPGVNGTAAEAPTAGADATAGGASSADLAAIIEGKSDDEIVALIKELGEDTFFGGIFEEMAKRFLPDRAAGKTAVIQYDIAMPDGTKTYQVVVGGGTCVTSAGAGQEATVTLALSAPDFLGLISGKLNGMTAFMSGKLKLKGDMMLAQTMQGWFDQS